MLSRVWSLVASAAILLTISAGVAESLTYPSGLSDTFYDKTCPNATQTVLNIIKKVQLSSSGTGDVTAGLVRLHFHDCAVRGCDASVLVKSTPGNLAEKDGPSNKNSLEGFELIDQIKTALEKICPKVVSCADIIALAARDALLVSRGLSYPVPLGRKDGLVSKASEAEANLPSPSLNWAGLVKNFAAKGLTPKDLVVLSGAHTFGDTHCKKVWPRLYSFSARNQTDPALNPGYAAQLKVKCPKGQPFSTTNVLLDPTKGGHSFDNLYYSNVLAGKTAFISDSALITDTAARALVTKFAASPSTFLQEFGKAMLKMGQVGVLTGKSGTIRTVCSKV
ncbi:hypothetical protein R1flu_018369 [Riccia fluitans]|uniref:Peroxidase n=1 Tax=Riccia fluitans TaxID=41844 RepID=A0ABD1ZHW7_9MARC